MRRTRCYNCGEPVERTGKCGVCAMITVGDWPNETVVEVHDRLSRWLDEHYYPGAHDDLRHLYELATEKTR